MRRPEWQDQRLVKTGLAVSTRVDKIVIAQAHTALAQRRAVKAIKAVKPLNGREKIVGPQCVCNIK